MVVPSELELDKREMTVADVYTSLVTRFPRLAQCGLLVYGMDRPRHFGIRIDPLYSSELLALCGFYKSRHFATVGGDLLKSFKVALAPDEVTWLRAAGVLASITAKSGAHISLDDSSGCMIVSGTSLQTQRAAADLGDRLNAARESAQIWEAQQERELEDEVELHRQEQARELLVGTSGFKSSSQIVV